MTVDAPKSEGVSMATKRKIRHKAVYGLITENANTEKSRSGSAYSGEKRRTIRTMQAVKDSRITGYLSKNPAGPAAEEGFGPLT